MSENILIKELSRIFEIMGNKKGINTFKSNLLIEQDNRLRLLNILKNDFEHWIEGSSDDFKKSMGITLGKNISKDSRPFKQRLMSWLEEISSKTVLTDTEKRLVGDFFVTGVKSSPKFREKYVNSQFEKWVNAEKKEGKERMEGIIKSTFGDDTLNLYKRLKDMKSLEKNYVHIDPLKPKINVEPPKSVNKTGPPVFEPNVESLIKMSSTNSNYTNKFTAEKFFADLYSPKTPSERHVKSKIINLFKDVFEGTNKLKHWSEIFDESKMNQINTMLDILDRKFGSKNKKITYGAGKEWMSIGEFRKNVLPNDKLLTYESNGVLFFSPINKLDTNFKDNSRVLMDWAESLPDNELERFKVMTNLFSEHKITYDDYSKELDYVLNKLKSDKQYPLNWFKNNKDRSSDWFHQNITTNTNKGNKSEEVVDNALATNGLNSEVDIPNKGMVKLTSLEGSPVDRLLNIDSIVQDTKGIFGNSGEFLTVQAKSFPSVTLDIEKNIYTWFGNSPSIAKESMIDILGLVNNEKFMVISKKNGKFFQVDATKKINNGYPYIDTEQVKITNIK